MQEGKIAANDPELRSWIEVPTGSDFPIQNLPLGVFNVKGGKARIGTRIGDTVLDLRWLADHEYFDGIGVDVQVFHQTTLNAAFQAGKVATRSVRGRLSELLRQDNNSLQKDPALSEALFNVNEVEMLLPVAVGDYTDFYSSREHATNVGTMFRDPTNALLPNWLHLPVGYHGRASSIIPSGIPIHRPKGQTKPNDDEPPVFGASKLLDFELEIGFITHGGRPLGESISTAEADEHIAGLVLFNDWSARDIQKWEYVPLGPFLAKNFASSISPWVVLLDALEPFRVAGPEQSPKVLSYLDYTGKKNLDIALEVSIEPSGGKESVVCRSNFKHMYWNMEQQLAHHTVNGCNVRAGDIMASGTISGPDVGSFGSMLELSWKGTRTVALQDGSERKFIQDNDTVIMRGHAQKNGVRIGFGEVRTKVLPAL